MAPLVDPDRLRAYKDALSNWSTTDYIRFELNEQADRWIRTELDGISYREIKRLMHEYVAEGGVIDEQRETRELWSDIWEFRYDLRFVIQGKPVYTETRLKYQPPFVPDVSWILVVNVHAPSS